jgi:hypothetical protein
MNLLSRGETTLHLIFSRTETRIWRISIKISLACIMLIPGHLSSHWMLIHIIFSTLLANRRLYETIINGHYYTIWDLFCDLKIRGMCVLLEVTRRFNGIIICDGWKPYSKFTNRLQRCWVHLLRVSKDLAEKHNEAIPCTEIPKRFMNHSSTLWKTILPLRSECVYWTWREKLLDIDGQKLHCGESPEIHQQE